MAYMRDKKGVRLDELLVDAGGDTRGYLPVMGSAKRNSTVGLPNNSTYTISWNTRVLDTSGCWSAGSQQRLTVPPGQSGVWGGKARVVFPTGVGGTRREVLITRVWALGIASSEIARTNTVPSGVARQQAVEVEIPPHVAQAGDYYTVSVFHDTGSDLNLVQDTSFFNIQRFGEARGKWDGVAFSADFAHRGDWSAYEAGGGQLFESVGLSVVPDPIDGDRLVGKILCKQENDSVLYPRVQAQTGAFMAEGTLSVTSISILIPEETHDTCLGVGHGFNILEHYGPPFGGAAPVVFAYSPTRGLNLRANLSGDAGTDVTLTYLWELAPEAVVGKWIDVTLYMQLDENPAVGDVRLYINTGSGMVRQTLSDGTTTGDHFNMNTFSEVNGGGNNFSSLKISWGAEQQPIPDGIVLYVGDHRAGDNTIMGMTDRARYSPRS